MDNVLLYFLALIVPLLFLAIIRKFDFYQTGQFSLIILCLCWGAIVYAPAALTNRYLILSGLANQNTVDYFIAPPLEEILKGLMLFYLIRRAQFTYIVDGALYGFATGIGFAIFENFENISQANSLTEILLRILSTNLVHAFSSAAIGVALGIFLFRSYRSRWVIFSGGVLVAIGQHMIFNIMEAGIHPIIKIFPGFLGMFFIYDVTQLGVKQARTWIREKLGMEKLVTQNEAAAVDSLANPDDILLPIVERFGAEKAAQVEKLLYLQARIGIKRKALDGFRESDAARKDLEAELDEMRVEMKKKQREIGTYVMLFVRELFTDDMVSVWDRMQAKIQERSAASGGQKGGGLWSSLDERVKSFMGKETITQLRTINWFDELPEDMLIALAKKVSQRTLSKGEVLFNKGDVGDSLFVIFEGRVKVITHDEDGNEITLNKVDAGEIIGEMSLLDHETRSAGIVALEKTSTLELKREDFMEVLKGHPDLALSVIRNLSKRLRHNTSYIEQITDMSRRVAGGDYSVINESQPEQTDENKGGEQEKVAQLMAEFIAMVREIREREEDLRNQVQRLSLQIDEGKRKQEFDEITSTDFYTNLKEQAQKLRAQRKDKKNDQ